MFRYGPLHAEDDVTDGNGRRRAVTIFRQSEQGVLVIAGLLHEDLGDKAGSSITRLDYFTGQRASFADWESLWDYFERSEFAPLLKKIRVRIAEIEREAPLEDSLPS